MFVELKRAVIYKGKKYTTGDIIEVGNDLGSRMILANQAKKTNKKHKIENILNLQSLSVKQLEALAKKQGIELPKKIKKAEIVSLLKENLES